MIFKSLYLGALLLLFSYSACSVPKSGSEPLKETSLPHITITGENGELFEFKVDLAKTPYEHMVGLMHRESLPASQGMLFIFDDESVRSFWMKNTLIPLDMIFIASSGQVVGIIHEAEPLTLDGRSVGRKSRYVLEINGGLCRKLGITTGSAVNFGENIFR